MRAAANMAPDLPRSFCLESDAPMHPHAGTKQIEPSIFCIYPAGGIKIAFCIDELFCLSAGDFQDLVVVFRLAALKNN